MGVKFPGKKFYVTLEWPPIASDMADRLRKITDFNNVFEFTVNIITSLQCLDITEFIVGSEATGKREHVDGGQRYIIVPSPGDVIEQDGYVMSWEIFTCDAGAIHLMVSVGFCLRFLSNPVCVGNSLLLLLSASLIRVRHIRFSISSCSYLLHPPSLQPLPCLLSPHPYTSF